MNANEREIVIRRQGDTFGFKLPESHQLELREGEDVQGRRLADLRAAGNGGETVTVVSIDERDEEIEYVVEPTGDEPTGYPWPVLQEEQERLKMQWADAGGNVSQFAAWRPGTSQESQFREWRAAIRRLRRGESPIG